MGYLHVLATLRARLVAWRRTRLARADRPREPDDTRVPRTLLVTGAAGAVATLIRPFLAQIYPVVRLSDCRPVAALAPNEEFHRADLTEADALDRAVAGVEGIVHLGALAKETTYARLLAVNMAGTVNLFEAARRHAVRRLVFASSMHVLGFYHRDQPLKPTIAPHPDSRYAVSKLFGENLGRLYADKYGLGVCCLRIGHVTATRQEAEPGNWISPADLVALIRIGLEHPAIRYEIFPAVATYAGDDLGQGAAQGRYGWRGGDPGGSYAAARRELERRFPNDPLIRRWRGGVFAASDQDLI